jgi:hypothetical protein
MTLILFIKILRSELMILKSGCKTVFVIAEQIHERSFDLRSFLIDLGVTRATRAMHNVDHAACEFPTGSKKLRTIPVVKPQSLIRQSTPDIGLRRVRVYFVDRPITQLTLPTYT